MSTAPKIDEAERLRIVEAYEVLDTPSEESFDRITRLAQKLFNVPIALVTILDDKRQHFKSRQGLRGEGAPRDIPFCTHAIRNERGLVVPDAQQDTRFAQNPLVTREQHIRFYAGAPLLTSQGVALGSLCIMDRKARSFDGAQVGMLADLAAMVMDELELRRLASRDPLTGLYNRGMFTQLAERALRRARRHDRPMSALILDIDKFKAVNDVYGHDAGDEVIKRVAELCKDTLREHDILGRWGGEEFVVAAPDTDLAQAFLLGERLRLAVEATSIQVGARPFNVTVSIGVTECGPEATSFTQPLARADVALYAAKSNGRNRTEKAAVEKGDSRAAAA